ncbi:hypothetical protein J2Z69_002820 [Paenibacillus shirakamiensis]|uniref:YtzI protein n=1 Tax=Paenibacillus shirakamiensis TaxID=1265935 RepID=A0ABS4JMD4_9BACL|nr:hypothetical protein [Paenibacillus shirakamiensis]
MALVYGCIIIVAIGIMGATFWVTKYAYSKKWDNPED